MPASQPANFNLQEFTDAGQLLVGGRLYTYGYGTTAPKTAFTDPDGTVPHTYTADGLGGQYIALNARGELPAPLYLGDGSYDISLKRTDGSTVWTRKADGVDSGVKALAAAAGSSLVGIIQAGAGAVPRTVRDKLREEISVQDYNVVGDGLADDTTALAAACAYAKSTSRKLKWNGANCKVTSNIPNLHGIAHIGPGTITRGGKTFSVSGSSDCLLYVATTGSLINDGLTSDLPMASLQAALLAVANYGPLVTQKFKIYIAAGSYPAPAPITHYTPSLQYVEVYGADVGGGRNVPITVIDGSGGAVYSHGIYAQGWGVRLKVQDVKLVNFNNGGGNAGDRTRGGVVFDRGAEGWTKNVHVTQASWFGIYGTSAQACLVESGILDGCRIGVNTDHTRCSVGWNALVAGSARPLIKNSTEQGVSWTNGTQGHVDYTDFQDNALALHLEGGSRCDAVLNDFKRNSVAVDCFPGGFFGNNPGAACTFNVGTADANIVDIRAYSGGGDYNGLLKSSAAEARVDQYRGNMTITGDTADHVIYTSSAFSSGFFKDARQHIRIAIYGVVTSAALPPTLKTTVAGVALASMAMPANAIPSQGFKLEIEMFSNGAGNHYVFQKLSAGSASLDRVSSGSYNFSFTDAVNTIVMSGAVQAASDTLTINRISIYAAG